MPQIDDSSISDDADLWRRIPPEMIIFDENLGDYRPTSQAFSDGSGGGSMSVYLGPEVRASGRSPEQVLKAFPGYALAVFSAGLARKHGQGVRRDPLPEEPAHALVVGRKTKAVQKAFARESRWLVRPHSSA